MRDRAMPARLYRAYDATPPTLSNSYAGLRTSVQQAANPPHGNIEMMHDIIHLDLTSDRLFDLTHRRGAKPPPAGYRFGRISAKSVHLQARRASGLARKWLDAVLRIITAAKLRRIEREFRIHGPRHDWLRIDDDNFTPVDR
jgi:hypothetical protein